LNQQDSGIFDFDEAPSEQLEDHPHPPPRYSLLNPTNNTPNVSRCEITRKTIRNIPKVIWMTSSNLSVNKIFSLVTIQINLHHRIRRIIVQ